MPDGFGLAGDLFRHIGQTVTVFTTSGGQSGRGFTGVLISVNNGFVRLILQMGSAPGCALGNCCDERRGTRSGSGTRRGTNDFDEDNFRGTGRINCRGNRLGAIVDIPINRIAAFVHNSVGSGW